MVSYRIKMETLMTYFVYNHAHNNGRNYYYVSNEWKDSHQ